MATLEDKLRGILSAKAKTNPNVSSVLNKVNKIRAKKGLSALATEEDTPRQNIPQEQVQQRIPQEEQPQIEKQRAEALTGRPSVGDVVKEVPRAALQQVTGFGKSMLDAAKLTIDFIDKGGAQAISAISAPIEATVEETQEEGFSARRVLKRAADIWAERANAIGHPLEEILAPDKEEGRGIRALVEPIAEDVAKKFYEEPGPRPEFKKIPERLLYKPTKKETETLHKVRQVAKLSGLGFTELLANPFYLFNITGIVKGSFKLPKAERSLVVEGMMKFDEETAALDVLGLKRGASIKDVNAAHRRLAHKYHPDKTGGDDTAIKAINQAKESLLKGRRIIHTPENRELPGAPARPTTGRDIVPTGEAARPAVVPRLTAGVSRTPVIPPQITPRTEAVRKKLEATLAQKQKLIESGRGTPRMEWQIQNTQRAIDALPKAVVKPKVVKKPVATVVAPETFLQPRKTKSSNKEELRREAGVAAIQDTKYTPAFQKIVDKYKQELVEAGLSKETANWLHQYEETRTGGIPSIKIQKELATTKPKKPIVLYRGLDLVSPKTFEQLSKGDYKTNWIDSWTYNKKTAKDFSQSKFQIYSLPDPPEGKYQVIIKATINPNKVFADLSKLPKIGVIKETPEVILKPGAFKVEVIESVKGPDKKPATVVAPKKPTPKAVEKQKATEQTREAKAEVERSKQAEIRLKLEEEKRQKAGKVITRQMTDKELKQAGLDSGRIEGIKESRRDKQAIEADERKALQTDLKTAKERGKDIDYFRNQDIKLYQEFLDGKTTWDKSQVVSDFIDKEFGDTLQRYDEALLKRENITPAKQSEILQARIPVPSEIANWLDQAWQWGIGNKALKAWDAFIHKLSELNFKVPIKGETHVFYPFEFFTGAKKSAILGPHKKVFNQELAQAKEQALDIGNFLAEFSARDQQTIVENIVNRRYPDNKLGQAAMRVEDKFVEIGQGLVDAGLMEEALFKEYLGKYFPRMFEHYETQQNFIRRARGTRMDKSYLKLKRDAFGAIYRQGNRKITEKFPTRAERDLFIKNLRAQGIKYETFSPLSESKKQELGEIKTAAYPAAKRMMQEMSDIAKVNYFNQVAANSKIARKEQDIAAGFVERIPDDFKYGALRNMYVHEWFIHDFKGLTQSPGTIDSSLRFFNTIVKGTKTILDPAVGTANMVSNFFLADMSGVPIERVDYWIRNLYNALANKGAYLELRKAGVTGKTQAGEELQHFIGLDSDLESFKKLLFDKKNGSIWDVASIIPHAIKKGWIKAGDLYSFSEDWAKATVYDWGVNELNMTKDQAIDFASEAIFDYSDVSRFINMLRSTPLGAPFPTFVAKIATKMIRTQIHKPFTIAKWHMFFGTLAALSLAKHGLTEQDIENTKPEWAGEWYIVGDVIRDKNGKVLDIQLIDLSRYLPWGQISDMPVGIHGLQDLMFSPKLGSLYGTGNGLLNAFSPGGMIFKPLAEVLFNKSLYFDQQIYDPNDPMITKVFKSADYLQRAWGPSWMPPLFPGGKGGFMFDKLWSAYRKKADWLGRRYSMVEAMLRVVGTKITHIEPEIQFDFAVSDIEKDIKSARSKIRSEKIRYNNARANRKNDKDTIEMARRRYETEVQKYSERKDRLKEERRALLDLRNEFFKTTTINQP